MNPLKTMKSLKKFMKYNKGKSESELANMLYPRAEYGTRFMSIIDMIRTYKEYYNENGTQTKT